MTTRTAGYDQAAAEEHRRATLEAMHQQISDGIAGLSDQWQAYLTFASTFHRYSFHNQVALWVQNPEATLVAGYRTWQAKGRQVRRGEKALKVLGPVTRRTPIVDAAGQPLRNPDGTPRVGVQLVGVKPVSVFDVSQTDGDPLPEPPQPRLLVGQAPDGLWADLQSFIEAQGFDVSRRDCGDANGVTLFDSRQVWVRPDLDDAAGAKVLSHEAAHVLMHRDLADPACRGILEVEAESVAYLVTRSHGLDSSQYTFSYVSGWAHQAHLDHPDASVEDIVRATGTRVIAAADEILQATKPAPADHDDALQSLDTSVTRIIDVAQWSSASERVTGPSTTAPPSHTLAPSHTRMTVSR